MGILATMRAWFFRPSCHAAALRAVPQEPPALQDGLRSIARARQANDRAAMGLTLTSGRAMSAETRIQALMADMLQQVDRARDAAD